MNTAEAISEFHESCSGICFLATCEGGQPRLRPMATLAAEGNVLWMAAAAGSRKMGQIAANPKVEVCYMDEEHRHLRLGGTAEVCADAAIKRRMWESYPLMQKYFQKPDDPGYSLLKITVSYGEVMDSLSMAYQTLTD